MKYEAVQGTQRRGEEEEKEVEGEVEVGEKSAGRVLFGAGGQELGG